MPLIRKLKQLPGKSSDGKAEKKESKRTTSALAQNKVLGENTPFHIREAYKALRTNVIFSLPEDGCKKIIVTSSQASEGKSINCLNLAIAFGENGSRVLLIDCDLRRPNIARSIDKQGGDGLSNMLVGLAKAEDVVNKNVFENVDIIFSGDIPPNPSELLGSEKFQKFLEELESQYDYIFLDSPPVNVVSDAIMLSRCATGVIFVVRQHRTDKYSFEEAIKQLEFAGAHIIGTVLNDTISTTKGYKYKRSRIYTGVYDRYYSRYNSGYYGRYGYGYSRGYGYGYGYGYSRKGDKKLEKKNNKDKNKDKKESNEKKDNQ